MNVKKKTVPQVIEYIECSYEDETIIHALCYFSRHAQQIFFFSINFLFQKTVFEVNI